MTIIETDNIILRDFQESDIEKRIEWDTKDREWQDWDAPWEKEPVPEGEALENARQTYQSMADMASKKSSGDMRYSFQIEVRETGEYIGWINCYCIDNNYSYTEDDGKYAFGIDIPPKSCRGKGYGYEAFHAVLNYLKIHGLDEIYTQTWSGNTRMVELAEKLGFVEINRKKDLRIVNGQKYDGLSFIYKGE